MEIDHEIISTVILFLQLNHSRRDVVSYKRKYVHEVLVNRLFKLAHEKVWLDEHVRPTMTIAVDWEVEQQKKQTKLLISILSLFTIIHIANFSL